MNICESEHASNNLLSIYSQSQGEKSHGVNEYILILEHTIHTLEMWFNFSLFLLQKFAGGL